jgi:hypothetical protein
MPRGSASRASGNLMPEGVPRGLCILALLGIALRVHASGGHHAVDDASILDPGKCLLETWADRFLHDTGTVLHAGGGCHVGSVELGLNLDSARFSGKTVVFAGPQAKWAQPVSDTIAAGLVVAASWRNGPSGYAGTTVFFPLTWQARDALLVHVNLGRDFVRGDADGPRAGIAVEWTPSDSWSFVAERFRELGASYWRTGARFAPSPVVNVDLSYARSIHESATSRWTVGVTWTLER